MNKIIFRIVETEAELQQCFAVRHSVFVEEQNIFFETDQDEFDKNAIHIAAIDTSTGKVVSTCLLYTSPSPRDGLLSRMPSSA